MSTLGHVCDVKVTYVACLHLFWYVEKKRSILLLHRGMLLQKWPDKTRFKPTLFHIFLPLNAPDCEKVPFAHVVLVHICTVSVF